MRIVGILLLIAVVSCVRRPYQPAGGPGPLNAGGYYDMVESVYSNNCGPGVLPRKESLRVQVEHTPGSGFAKIIVNERFFYDATVRSDGNFAVGATRGGDTRASFRRTISGKFTSSSMYARVSVDSIKPVVSNGRPAGTGDEGLRVCSYQLRWDAQKL